MKNFVMFICVGLGLGFFAACSEKPAEPQTSTPAVTNTSVAASTNAAGSNQVFQVKGVIQQLNPEEREVVIKHEEIPNYMAAMTMPFEVKNTNELAGLNPGDEVTFAMIVNEEEGWIENIKKTGATNTVTRPSIRVVRDVKELEEGDVMTDYAWTNTLGNVVRFSDHKGKALALTFIFTRCPFPNFCPRLSSNFGDTAKILKSNPNAPTNWHMFSISFDPDYDTPARLRAYSKIYGADPAYWDFVTGAQIDIDAITDQFHMPIAYNNGTFDHRLRTAVIDAAGKVHKILVGNEWTPQELAEEIIKAAKVKPDTQAASAQK